MEVTAIYFPSYHRDALNDQWYGPGWNEWRLMEAAQPLFAGHEQPKLCTWGAFDEADPAWMERQIDLAADHGITTFLWDWYWYSGTKFLHRALEEGFLKARNRHRLKFFIMWANHTWGVFPACRGIFRGPGGAIGGCPAPAAVDPAALATFSEGQALAYDKPLLEIKHTLADLERVAEYCAAHYFHEPNYSQVDGRPIFSFWRWEELATQLGGVAGVAQGFERMRSVARRHGFPGLHIQVNIACYEGPETRHCWWPALADRAREAGADSVYGYNVARTHGYPTIPNALPVVPYDDVIASHHELFRLCENRAIPFHPVATVGFDNTPRWHRGVKLPVDFRKHFYEPICIGNTPAKFRLALEAALASLDRQAKNSTDKTPRMLLINAWNEWSEGCQLLPTTQHGSGYLETLKRVLDGRSETEGRNQSAHGGRI